MFLCIACSSRKHFLLTHAEDKGLFVLGCPGGEWSTMYKLMYRHRVSVTSIKQLDCIIPSQTAYLPCSWLCAMQKPVLTKGYYVNTLLMRSFSLIKTDFPVLTLFLKQTAGTLEKKPEHFRALTKSSHCGPKYLNHPTPPWRNDLLPHLSDDSCPDLSAHNKEGDWSIYDALHSIFSSRQMECFYMPERVPFSTTLCISKAKD